MTQDMLQCAMNAYSDGKGITVLELWRYLAFVEPLPQAATRTRE
jgi:hypothetical protein